MLIALEVLLFYTAVLSIFSNVSYIFLLNLVHLACYLKHIWSIFESYLKHSFDGVLFSKPWIDIRHCFTRMSYLNLDIILLNKFISNVVDYRKKFGPKPSSDAIFYGGDFIVHKSWHFMLELWEWCSCSIISPITLLMISQTCGFMFGIK